MRTKEVVVSEGRVQIREQELPETPAPKRVRIRTLYSAVSQGTELLTIRRSALEKAAAKLLGYQVVGEVVARGEGTPDVPVGKLVACYGAPYVYHGSVLDVPPHLCSVLPAGVPPQEASFCGLGTVALHSVRVGKVSLGDVVAVVGLGVLGNLVAQLASRAGAHVLGVDTNEDRIKRAIECGIRAFHNWQSLEKEVVAHSGSEGADVVFLVANACGNDLLEQCVDLLRLRGTLVIVGNTDAVLPREALFMKEAFLVVSRAGGPGRYDPLYEAEAIDYPYGYVRWTQGRNLQEFVRQLSLKKLALEPLITTIVPSAKCVEIYETLAREPHKHCGVLFDWREESCEQ